MDGWLEMGDIAGAVVFYQKGNPVPKPVQTKRRNASPVDAAWARRMGESAGPSRATDEAGWAYIGNGQENSDAEVFAIIAVHFLATKRQSGRNYAAIFTDSRPPCRGSPPTSPARDKIWPEKLSNPTRQYQNHPMGPRRYRQ